VIVYPPLLNEQVTAANLKNEFERLGKRIRPDDVFVVFMVGHGRTDDGRYYFLPYDVKYSLRLVTTLASSIRQDQLQEWVTFIPALKSILIYNTCESGAVAEDRSAFREVEHAVATEKLSLSMGRTVLAAASDVSDALEGYKQHGIFTFVLLEA